MMFAIVVGTEVTNTNQRRGVAFSAAMKSISFVVALALAACGGGGSPPTTPPAPKLGGDPACPVEVPGTTVTVEESERGAALVFVTTGDIPELRARATAMAAQHNAKRGMLPAGAAATAEDVVGGARIVFAGDGAVLAAELRMHATHLGAGSCAMDDHAGHAPSEPAPAEPTPAEPTPPAPPDPDAARKALAAAELAAYDAAKPVFDAHCARCHVKGQKGAKKSALKHFDMTSYPFGGHHADDSADEIRHVLGVTGKKPSMPRDKPGAVTGDELGLILAWADAFDAARAGAGK